MNKKEAKEILLGRRPWSRHTSEEETAATNLAAKDADLAQFQKSREQFNTLVHKELTSIPVPPGLREQILARKREDLPDKRKIVEPAGWRPSHLLALAASIVVFASALFYFTRPREDTSIAGFRSRMAGFAVREYRMDLFTQDMNKLRDFLGTKGRPANFELPPKLATIPLKGGASLSWQDKPVSMVCFDWAKNDTLYMFVVDKAAAATNTAAPQIESVKGLTTATWTSGGKTFLLAGRLSSSEIEGLVRF